MNDKKNDKPTDHGQPRPTAPPARKTPRVPAQFRGGIIDVLTSDDGACNYSRSVEKYGLWTVRALRSQRIFGVDLAVNDTIRIPGNCAVEGVLGGDFEFIDERLAHEEKVMAEVARLKLPVPARDNPAFAPREQHDPTAAGIGASNKLR